MAEVPNGKGKNGFRYRHNEPCDKETAKVHDNLYVQNSNTTAVAAVGDKHEKRTSSRRTRQVVKPAEKTQELDPDSAAAIYEKIPQVMRCGFTCCQTPAFFVDFQRPFNSRCQIHEGKARVEVGEEEMGGLF